MLATVSPSVQFFASLLVGFATGVLSGMFGIGGAVVSTPAIRVLGATPLQGVGSTLPSIFPSSITGTLRYQREGMVRWDAVLWTGLFGVGASVAGALLAASVPGHGHVLMIATAVLVGFTGYRTARPRERVLAGGVEGGHELPPLRLGRWRLGVIGVIAGLLSGLLGVGGGIVMVPAYTSWLRIPLKEAIATSLAVVGILAIPGTITHALLGHIAWRFAIPLSIGVIPGARLGARLAIQSSDRRLRTLVGVILGCVAVIYATGEVLALVN
jgi:uncharacterized protein